MSFSSPTGVSAPRTNISGFKTKNVANFTPQQMQLFSQLLGGTQGSPGLSQGLSRLSNLAGGSEEGFDQLEAPAYSAFNKLLGNIGSRFANVGALDSSAFQNATSGAAADLSEKLGSQRMGIQQDALDRLMGLSERLLGQRPYDTFLQPQRTGWDTAGDITSMISKILPFLL